MDFETLSIAGRAVFGINGMWCASCAMALQRAMGRVKGVSSATVNFTSASAMLTWDPDSMDFTKLVGVVENLGYEIVLMADEDSALKALQKQARRIYIQLSVAVVFGMWSMLGSWVLYLDETLSFIHYQLAVFTFLLALPVVFYSGLDFYRAAIKTLRVGVAGMDAMISLGVWGSVLVSLWHLLLGQTDMYVDAATMLITFLLIGRLIEIKARQESRLAVDALRKLAPETVTRLDKGEEASLRVEDVQVGEVVLVRSGERVAVDGLVQHGESQLDCTLLTGESYPVSIKEGAHVFAGSINLTAPIRITVEKVFGERRIDLLGLRMLELFGGRSTLAVTAETFIRYLFPLTVTAAIAAFVYYATTGVQIDRAVLSSLSILVAACPCAVGLALPLAYALGSRKAAQEGILWRDPASVENLAQAKVIAFDKTGTLTTGELEVDMVQVASGWNRTELLKLASQAEAGVAHPIASALREAAKLSLDLSSDEGGEGDVRLDGGLNTGLNAWESTAGLSVGSIGGRDEGSSGGQASKASLKATLEQGSADLALQNQEKLPTDMAVSVFAQGVAMTLANGDIVRVGSYRWLASLGIQSLPKVEPNVVYVAHGDEWVGSIHLRNQMRSNLRELLGRLKSRFKLDLWLITGDSEVATSQLVEHMDMEFGKVAAHCAPEEKAQLLHDSEQRPIAFVGDGANDALVLASADCGIAIPGASSVAVAAAGMVVTKGGLEQVETSLVLARKLYRIVRQNLFFSIVYNALVVCVLFASGVTPFAAAIAMLLSSLTVFINTLRLL